MHEIDSLDILGYFDLLLRAKQKKRNEPADGMPPMTTTDQIRW